MTEKEIQEIVEEVIRRIHLRGESKKILAIVNSPADIQATDTYLEKMENDYSVTMRYVNGGEGTSEMGNCCLQTLMAEHCALILSGITLKQLSRMSEMQLEDPVVEAAAEALRLGKPVTVLPERIGTACGTPAFTKKIDEIKTILISYGVTFADAEKPEEDKGTETENRVESCRSHRHRIDKRVIAKQDLKHVLQGELEIREDAVMTTTAKDLLKKRKIRITRYEQE